MEFVKSRVKKTWDDQPFVSSQMDGVESQLVALEKVMSRIQKLTSDISHICQEIRDIKRRKKPQTNIAIRNYTNTGLVEE